MSQGLLGTPESPSVGSESLFPFVAWARIVSPWHDVWQAS